MTRADNISLVSEDIEALTRGPIDTVALREREAKAQQGCWYSLRIRPYKNVDNRTVIAMADGDGDAMGRKGVR